MKKTRATVSAPFFLPDLCRVNAVFLLVIVTQLLAFLFTLIAPNSNHFSWNYLGLVSLFGHWTVLTCAALLCVSRQWLASISLKISSLLCLLIILAVTFACSLLAYSVFELAANADFEWFLFRNMTASAVIGSFILRYFYLQNQWREQKHAELRARLEALQSRIRPHFLFNSLNSIASLIAVDPARAEDAILDLSEIFRATLKTDRLQIPLSEELDLCARYLNIEQLRLGDRLRIEWFIDKRVQNMEIPPLMLQPLVENAVYHGIQPRKEGGTIRVRTEKKADFVYIMISNPSDPESGGRKNSQRAAGNQIAIENIRHRITTLYGERAVLKCSLHNNQYVVTLRFPVMGGEN
ncbi:MAG: histidine kinase [Proteobacteria bacterium]|nr:MAG: histidine kinase [Pseudomonadota bacterium]